MRHALAVVLACCSAVHRDYQGAPVVIGLRLNATEELNTTAKLLTCRAGAGTPNFAASRAAVERLHGEMWPVRLRGMFNVGSHYVYELMKHRVPVTMFNPGGWYGPEGCFRWKHMPLNVDTARKRGACRTEAAVPVNELHLVVARHPLSWLLSMRGASYSFRCVCQSNSSITGCWEAGCSKSEIDHRNCMAVPKPRNGPGANSTLSVAAMLRGPCELFSTDGHFGPLRVAYDGAFELWNRFYGDFVDLAAASPNVLVLRYEDILRNETGAIREIAARARCALDAKFAQTSGKSLVPRKVGPQVAHGDLPSKAVQLNQAWRASWSQAELRTACRLFDARVMARLRYTCDDANVSADSGRPPHARCDETVQKLAALALEAGAEPAAVQAVTG